MSIGVDTPAIDAQLPRPEASPRGRLGEALHRLPLLRRLPGSYSIAIGGTATAVFVLIGVFAPLLAPHSPYDQQLADRLKPPAWLAGGSAAHLLGTDQLGRDVLSRLLYGGRVSLLVGLGAVIGAGVLGVLLGVTSAYWGGKVDYAIQRVTELFQAFPFLLLGITVMAFLGSGVRNLIIVLVLTRWVQFCRVVRAEVLSLKSREYILAATGMGSNSRRIVRKHILPNVAAPIIVVATFSLATAILGEASLSFLGVGVPPDVPTWGAMLSGGQRYMYTDAWLTLWPGLFLFLFVIAVNLLGDGLRDLNDPKLRGRR